MSRESSQRAHRFRHSHRHPDERMCFAQWLCHHHRSRSYLRVRRNKNKLRPTATLNRSTAGYFPSLRSAMITSLRLIQHTKYPRHQIGRNQYAKRSLQNDSAYSEYPGSDVRTCSTHSRKSGMSQPAMQSTTVYTAITYSAIKGEPCTASQRLSISLHGRKGSGGRCLTPREMEAACGSVAGLMRDYLAA